MNVVKGASTAAVWLGLHNYCIMNMWLWGASCAHCDTFTVKQLRSHLALFMEDGSQASLPRGGGPVAVEAEHHLHSWGSQLDLADELGTGLSFSQSSIASLVALEPNPEALFPVSSGAAESMLLGRSSSEETDVTGVEVDIATRFLLITRI
ncbi:hypothetical protein Q8A67_012429 [Cirrhinus molitorella]|uniref:Uncharacterized protein n=1 Tax=Cirrhinus molitorella TaxID=172907 RepID=A0AA88TL95_9TELE|nr:hypothetical protein Q8A67_012429 [Cirrhinus molitorella]